METMEANELMIGDWADFAPELSDQPIAKIVTVNDLYMIDNGRMVVRPIPLTPEILEKNGFDKEGVIELYNLYAGIDQRVTIHNDKEYINSDNEWYVHVDSEDYSTIAGCELTYVHELQHILRLCKIDKEIVV